MAKGRAVLHSPRPQQVICGEVTLALRRRQREVCEVRGKGEGGGRRRIWLKVMLDEMVGGKVSRCVVLVRESGMIRYEKEEKQKKT